MADNRNIGLHGHPPGGLNMMGARFVQPGGGCPPNMMMTGTPGMNMMAAGVGMRPAMGPGIYQMQPGFMPRMPVNMMAPRGIAPPAYTAQMAQSYTSKQRKPLTAEQMREREEQLRKEREYQEQRMKLQNFSNVGRAAATSLNADKFIESMFGKSDRSKMKPTEHNKNATVVCEDDGFGDFMQGPSVAAFSNLAVNSSAVNSGVIQATTTTTGSSTPGTAHPSSNNVGADNQEPVKNGKDLMSMMMECSDLTTPKEAKHFERKRRVSETQPHHSGHIEYHSQSLQARNWTNTEQLSELFLAEAVTNQSSGGASDVFQVPAWCQSPDSLPPLYKQVQEASLVDDKVSTERLYPILMLSGLSREGLGHIWSLANRTTPGELTLEELYMALALIALAQNNYSIPSLQILAQCPKPPTPFLGHGHHHPPGNNHAPPATASTEPVQVNSHIPSPATDSAVLPVMSIDQSRADTEFTDFQAGPSPKNSDMGDDFGDFKAAETNNVQSNKPRYVVSIPKPDESQMNNLTPEEEHSNVTNFFCSDDSSNVQHNPSYLRPKGRKGPTTPNSLDDYYFDDGKSGGSKVSDCSQFSSHSEQSEGEDFRVLDSYMDSEQGDGSDKSPTNITVSSRRQINTMVRPPSAGVKTALPPKHVPPCTLPGIHRGNQGGVAIRPVHLGHQQVPLTNLSAFQSGGATLPDDDFSDFQEAEFKTAQTKSSSEVDLLREEGTEDKYAALRGWSEDKPDHEHLSILDTESTPVTGEVAGSALGNDSPEAVWETAPANQEEDWANFQDCVATEDISSAGYLETPTNISTQEPVLNDPSSVHSHQNDKKALNLFSCKDNTCGTSIPEAAFHQSWNGTDASYNKPHTPLSKSCSNISNTQPSPVDPELHSVDFDLSRVPPPMDDLEDHEDEFGDFLTGTNIDSPSMSPAKDTSFGFAAPSAGSYTLSSSGLANSSSKTVFPSSQTTSVGQAGGFNSGQEMSLHGNDSEKLDKSEQDNQSVSSLELCCMNIKGNVHTIKGLDAVTATDARSTDSGEFGGLESACKQSAANLESKSLDSLELGDSPDFSPDNEEKTTTPESKSLDSLDLKNADSREWSPEENNDENSMTTTEQKLQDSNNTPVFGQPHVTASTLLQQRSLQALGDRYSSIREVVPGSDRHVFEWERCLENANNMIRDANCMFNSISSSSVFSEIIKCGQGTDYLLGIVGIYRVVCRIALAMKTAAISSDKLGSLLKTIHLDWTNLTAFIASSAIMPDPSSLDYGNAVLRSDDTASQLKACGVCLLNVDSRSKGFNKDKDGSKLTYGGRQYHTSCANFWLNRVDPMLPALRLPELL